jgi:hypothetical protein
MTPRMTHAPGIPETVCAYSGVVAADNDFTHPDDMAAGLKVVEHAFHADAADAVQSMLDDLVPQVFGQQVPRRQDRLAAATETGASVRAQRSLARVGVQRMRARLRRVRDLAVLSDCGSPNIHLHFAREVALVREQVELAGSLSSEQSELAYGLMGNAHEDVLTTFEATLKTVYLYKVVTRRGGAPEVKSVGNAFQSIERHGATRCALPAASLRPAVVSTRYEVIVQSSQLSSRPLNV